jgi:hypothetical protein
MVIVRTTSIFWGQKENKGMIYSITRKKLHGYNTFIVGGLF